MTAERELMLLKSALRLWANAKTYEEACRRWKEVSRLLGEDLAKDAAA